jgi:hypothetical protein
MRNPSNTNELYDTTSRRSSICGSSKSQHTFLCTTLSFFILQGRRLEVGFPLAHLLVFLDVLLSSFIISLWFRYGYGAKDGSSVHGRRVDLRGVLHERQGGET